MKPSPSDLAYVAGLLEGEGSFILQPGKTVRISCEMTDVEPLQKLQDVMGGRISGPRIRGDYKPLYAYHLSTRDDVHEWCKALLPLMSPRRQGQIQVLVNYLDANPRKHRAAVEHGTLTCAIRNRCKRAECKQARRDWERKRAMEVEAA